MASQVRGGVGVGVRRAHLVGSIPAGSAEEAMRLAVKRLGPELDYLPDGETGMRRNWVLGMIEGFRPTLTCAWSRTATGLTTTRRRASPSSPATGPASRTRTRTRPPSSVSAR